MAVGVLVVLVVVMGSDDGYTCSSDGGDSIGGGGGHSIVSLHGIGVVLMVAVVVVVMVVVVVVAMVAAAWRGRGRPTHNVAVLCLPFLMIHQHRQLTTDYYISANVNVEEMPLDYTH